MLGWIGLVILVSSYGLLLTKWSWLFVPVDCVASAVLTLYALSINDLPFIIVNGWITVVLLVKWYNRSYGVV